MDTYLLLGGYMAGRYSVLVDDVLRLALALMIILTATSEFATQQKIKALTLCHRFQDTFMHGVKDLVSTIQRPPCNTLIIISPLTVLGTRKL